MRCRITRDGFVFMCSHMKNPLGNVLTSNFDELWNGDLAESIREATRNGQLHDRCAKNSSCPFIGTRLVPNEVTYSEYPTSLEVDLDGIRLIHSFNAQDNKRFYDVLARIRYVIPNLDHIHILGRMEPFQETRPDNHLLFDMLEQLEYEKHRQRIMLTLTTDAVSINKAVREEYLKRCPKSITTFVSSDHEEQINNMWAYSMECNRPHQTVRLLHRVSTSNVQKITDLIKLAFKVNVDCLQFESDDTVTTENCGRFARAQYDIIEECQRLNLKFNIPRPLDLGLTELVQLF